MTPTTDTEQVAEFLAASSKRGGTEVLVSHWRDLFAAAYPASASITSNRFSRIVADLGHVRRHTSRGTVIAGLSPKDET